MTNEPPADDPRTEDVEETGSAAAGPVGQEADAATDEGTQDHDHDQESAVPSTVTSDEPTADAKAKPKAAAEAGSEKPPAATPKPADAEPVTESASGIDELRNGLNELTRDLQRVTAEYANYRKRVDRDRTLVAEQATGAVLTQLLPVLDDLDRARNHGDLVGPFASVAEQLSASLGKFGLTPFGDVGDPFDPTLHEAVAHTSSPDVTETSCVEIMRRGYLLGERLLRPALVAVADPE